MKKLLLALPLVAGISWAGTTYYSGAQTEAAYNRMLEQLNALTKDIYVFKSTEFEPGIMESTAVTEVRSVSPTPSQKDILLYLKHQINHSLVSVAPENPRFGAASIITTLLVEEKNISLREFVKSHETGEMFVATTDVAVDGSTTSEIKFNAVDHSEDNSTFKSSGAVINLVTTANGNATGDLVADSIMLNDNDYTQLSSSDMAAKFNMNKLENEQENTPQLYDLDFDTTWSEFSVIDGGSNFKFNLANLSAKLNLGKFGSGKELSPIFYALHFDELDLETIDFEDLNYEVNLGKMDFGDDTKKNGSIDDMIMKVDMSKSENTGAESPIFYDINIETALGDASFFENADKNADISNFSFKLSADKLGNGQKIPSPSHKLKIEDLKVDSLNYEASIGKVDVVSGADEKVSASDIIAKFNMKKSGEESVSPLFFDANLEAKMGKIDVLSDGKQRALIEGANYVLNHDLSSDKPSSSLNIGVDSIKMEAVPLKSFDVDIALTGFSMTEMLANESLYAEMKTASEPEKILFSEESIAILRATFKPDTKMAIELDAVSSEGNGDAAVDLWFTGNGSDDGYTGMATLGDLAKAFAGTADVDIDKAALMLTPLGQMLDHPMAQAYLTITENKVATKANLDKLVLKVNEQVIPLDLMAGEKLKMPLQDVLKQF